MPSAMTKRWIAIGAAAAVLALAACGGGTDDDSSALAGETAEPSACTDMLAVGRPVADVVASAANDGVCTHGDERIITVMVSFPCSSGDGRQVYYPGPASDGTTFGFGIDGGTWQSLPPGQGAPGVDVC